MENQYTDIIRDVPKRGSEFFSRKIDYNARYFVMENSSGERIVVDRWDHMRKYKKMARGWVNYTQHNGLIYYKHITLTQKVENYKPNILNNFFNCLRRRYGELSYIWTAEVQEERFEKYGESVLHWHVVCAFQAGTDINVDEIARLQKYWKYGNLDCRSVKKLNLNYILKYITKSLNNSVEISYKIRRISMSRVPDLYRHLKLNFIKAIKWSEYNIHMLFKYFRVDKKGIYYRWYDDLWQKWRKDYAVILNQWFLIGSCDGEPF